MKRAIGFTFIFIGVVLLVESVWAIKTTEKGTEKALIRAEQLLQQHEPSVESETNPPVKKVVNELNDVIGILRVPKINAKLPIVDGTEIDDLKKGVGHYKGTALPRDGEQIVLSGHRDTVFTNFDQLEVGDDFIVDMPTGSFTYEIRETEIVDSEDLTVIRPRGEEVLTVTTCYPFNYIGYAPDRYVMYAYPKETRSE